MAERLVMTVALDALALLILTNVIGSCLCHALSVKCVCISIKGEREMWQVPLVYFRGAFALS